MILKKIFLNLLKGTLKLNKTIKDTPSEGWNYLFASVKGTSHEKSGLPKQDSALVSTFSDGKKEYLVGVVADGAGSAKYSDASSKFICKFFIKKTKNWLKRNELSDLKRENIKKWFTDFKKVINRAVKIYKIDSSREFATTLLCVVLTENFNVFVQIGDGAISVGDDNNNFECVFWPQNGEFLNTTSFATENNSENKFMFKTSEDCIKRVAMHTDGIELIALDMKNQKPFLPFFSPFFNALKKIKTCGYSENLSKQAEMFLQSEKVNQKTDDDKTLLMIIRHQIDDEVKTNE